MKYTYLFCELKSTIGYHSTVTDWSFPTKFGKFVPFLTFVCVIIYYKGSIVSTEYKDFDIVFVEKI